MSDTESFEQAMEIARHVMCEECELIDDYGSLCQAHDGCLDCERDMASRLKRAHDREIRDTAQQEYHRGYEDGQHSMDAEHRAIASKVMQVPYDDDAMEFMFHISAIICGGYYTSNKLLRDELVRLMGGVSDENVHVGGLRCDDGCMGDVPNGKDTGRAHDAHSNRDRNHMAVREGVDTMIGDSDDTAEPITTDEFIAFIEEDARRLSSESNYQSDKNGNFCETGGADDTCDSQCRGACATDCGRDSGEHAEVSDDCVDCDILGPDARGHAVGRDFHELGVSDGRTADDSTGDTGGSYRGVSVHLDGLVAYDVLDNERRKAIAKLRKCDGSYILEWNNIYEIYDALGVDYIGMSMAEAYENLRDRLIHLLGGDQPSGIDVLREMDGESDTNGTSPNDDGTSSITDELRKWASDRHCKGMSHTDVLNIGLIADRIDEQFNRICHQQEAVLQSIIDEVVEERKSDRLRIEKLERQRDEARQECADLLDLLRDATKEYVNTQAVCDELRYQREELMRKWIHERAEREELQARLDKANGENKGLRLSIDEQKESIAQRKKTIKKLARDNEKVWKTVHELQAKLDECDRTHVELPRDANNEVFRVGCTVRMVERHPEVLLTVHGMTMCDDGEWLLMARDDEEEYFCNHSASEFEVCEKLQDTAESIVRDLSMGSITESEAVERIGALNG